jgi:hypothetical protein
MNLGALQVHFGPTGFLSYVIPAMLVLCGLMTWATPSLRLFYGILGSLVAVYSLIGLNLGGFVLGLILGIIGGALAVAWTPIQLATPAGATHQTAPEAAAPEDAAAEPAEETAEGAWFLDENGDQRPRYDHGQPYENPPVYGNADTQDIPRHVRNPERWWHNGKTGNAETGTGASTAGSGDPEPPPDGGTSGGYRTRMFAITLVPVTLAAVALMAFNHAGLAYAVPVPCPTARATATKAPAPARSESTSPSPRPSTGTGSTPAKPGAPKPAPSGSGKSAAPPSASTSIVPCLGPGVIRSAAVDPGQPPVAATQAVLTIGSLTMYNSTYDGVVDLPTRTGTVHSLKFSMPKAVNKPFQLKAREPNGKSTVITSTELTLDGNVKFYTPKFVGKLFGLAPVTFTPDSPPPLTLPVLWFTDVTIDLAFVTCDTLTAPGMRAYQE